MSGPLRLLLLGGTAEASRFARTMSARKDVVVITSLAGRTSKPVVSGEHRVGGFGGIDGLIRYLKHERIATVVDATHPFAAVMRWHAFDACDVLGVPRIRLERPGWSPHPGDQWTRVPDLASAATTIAARPDRRVFLSTGRSELAAFVAAATGERWWLIRSIDPPDDLPLWPAEVILGRGPFDVGSETELLRRYRIDLLVTKDSGGVATSAKLVAARDLGVQVLVVDRPPSPEGPAASTVTEAVSWALSVLALPTDGCGIPD